MRKMRKMSKKLLSFFTMLLMVLTMSSAGEAALSVNEAVAYAPAPGEWNPDFDYVVGDTLYLTADYLYIHTVINESVTSRLDAITTGAIVVVRAVYPEPQWLLVDYVSPRDGMTKSGYCAAYKDFFSRRKQGTPTETKYSGNMLARVLKNNLEVYKTPYTTGGSNLKSTRLEYNWEVKALAYTSNGMTKVKFYKNNNRSNTDEGYVDSRYLYIYKATAEYLAVDKKFSTVSGYTVTTTADILNVHKDLDFWGNDTRVFTTVPYGTKMNLLKQSEHWYYVSFYLNGSLTKGYIRRDWATKSDALKNNVKLNLSNLTLKYESGVSGVKKQLSVIDTTYPSVLKKTVKWSSSDKSVVTVSSKGKVQAVGEGTAKITCKVKVGSRTRNLTCKVTVVEDSVG